MKPVTLRWRIGLAVFVAIAAVRLSLALYIATPVPFYDEWQAVIDQIARPALAHAFDPGVLLALHNEHVLALSRLLQWCALLANDMQFDNTMICVFNQLWRAAFAALLIVLALPIFSRRPRLFVLAATLSACLPYDWENIGMGFADSYFLLAGFSVLTIIAAAHVRRAVAGAVGLMALSLLAAMSMGSGYFAAAIALPIVAWRWYRGDLRTAAAITFCTVLAACMAAGIVLTWHATHSIHLQAVQALQIVLVLLVWIPAGLLGLVNLRRRRVQRCDLALLGVALWGLAQILTMIGARPEFRLWQPTSRYMEIIAIAAIAVIGCLLRVAAYLPELRSPARLALPIFTLALALGAPYAIKYFDWHADVLAAQAQRIRQYVRDHDDRAITDAPLLELAHPSSRYLIQELQAPDVRWILGDTYGTRPRPAPLTAWWRGADAWLHTSRFVSWLAAIALCLALLPPAWRRVRLQSNDA